MKAAIITIIVLLIIGLTAWFFLFNKPSDDRPASEQSTTTTTDIEDEEEAPEEDEAVALTITYTDSGFDPEEAGPIGVGDRVRFVNNSSSRMWVASDEHPTHEEYSEFDDEEGISKGEAYEFTFTKPGNWGFHNHLRPEHEGSVTVSGE